MLAAFCCLVSLLAVAAAAKSSPYVGIRWWELGYNGATRGESNSFPEDRKMSLLTKQQRRLFRRNADSADAVSKGTRLATDECQYQFRNKLWNCSTVKSKGSGFMFGELVGIGCRETSFLYAIMSAATTVAVSRACGEGSIYTCTCDRDRRKQPPGGPEGEWSWGGCSDNLRFGGRIAERLADGGGDAWEPKHYLRSAVNRHNSAAGRATVVSLAARHCKCHGTSGSCSVKTCWVLAPHMRQVGSQLMRMYDVSRKVYADNTGRSHWKASFFVPVDAQRGVPTTKDLVHYDESPDYCNPNVRLGTEGTSGRECNVTSSAAAGGEAGSCQSLCCGRGHRTERRRTLERCGCRFHWCCEVTCDLCERVSDRSMCL